MSYPKPSITADIIVQSRKNNILLIRRKNEPFKDCLALPGGFFDPLSDESLVAAAIRELREETNIVCKPEELYFFRYCDAKDRDPRDRVISFVYLLDRLVEENEAVASDDAASIAWSSPYTIRENLVKLAFDHKEILDLYLI